MEPTRRLWAIAGLAVGTAVFAVVLARPLALAGVIVIGAWIISRQYLFSRAVTTLADEITVTHTPATRGVRTDETVPTTLSVTLQTPSALMCVVEGGIPIAASPSDSLEVTVDPQSTTASATVDITWPVAGQHTFEPATLTVTDGLFHEQLSVGSTPTVTVEPRGPRNLHVGEGGDQISTAYGEHDTGRFGSGIEPAELREYVPGDTADRIDWNATARLGTPYVREFDAETDRRTLLFVDHRHSLAEGTAREQKIDYLRELALALTESARQLNDPLGLITIGDEGVTERLAPSTHPDQYTMVRRSVLELDPTGEPTNSHDKRPSQSLRRRKHSGATLADVRRTLAELDNDDSLFAQTLHPFYADRQHYLDRISTKPLYEAVQTSLAKEQGQSFSVICTDDSAPTELLEAVKTAAHSGGTALVLLAPSVLYETGGLSDVERAYERYLDFEELRREIARIDGVTALEVGPGDRLSAVLAAGRDRPVRVGGESI